MIPNVPIPAPKCPSLCRQLDPNNVSPCEQLVTGTRGVTCHVSRNICHAVYYIHNILSRTHMAVIYTQISYIT